MEIFPLVWPTPSHRRARRDERTSHTLGRRPSSTGWIELSKLNRINGRTGRTI
jgi:hypothetical protein